MNIFIKIAIYTIGDNVEADVHPTTNSTNLAEHVSVAMGVNVKRTLLLWWPVPYQPG